MKTAIVTDSNSGVTQIEAQKMNVFVLPMPVIIEGQAYYEGIDLLPDQFFRALTERQAVSTSQPSPGDVTALWDKVLTEYDELVYIPMSSGLSASCATAQMLAEDYEGRVFVVDNHRISISQKSSAWDAVALREAGCGAQEIQRELADQLRRLRAAAQILRRLCIGVPQRRLGPVPLGRLGQERHGLARAAPHHAGGLVSGIDARTLVARDTFAHALVPFTIKSVKVPPASAAA
mgnify:CR=1 FL=1